MSTNAYGLDVDYCRRKLERVLRDLDRYTPDELARECARLSRTVDDRVLQEVEFAPAIDERAAFEAFHFSLTKKHPEQQPKSGSYNDGWTTGANLAWFARGGLSRHPSRKPRPLQLWHCLGCRSEWPTDRPCDVCDTAGIPGELPAVPA